MEEVVSTVATNPAIHTSIMNTVAQFMQDGGAFMWVILAIWFVGLCIFLERFQKFAFKYDVDGPTMMNEIQRYILSSDVQGAIRVCSGSASLLARVLKSGLKRAKSTTAQIQNAIDAAALEVIPKIELRLNYIGLAANISTLVGLLGTIQGLIQSFAAVASADPSQKSELLTMGIAKAMNTTALGLVSAISLMILHAFLTAKSEKIIGEIDEFSVKLMDLFGTQEGQDSKES